MVVPVPVAPDLVATGLDAICEDAILIPLLSLVRSSVSVIPKHFAK